MNQVVALAWLCLFFFALIVGISIHDTWLTMKYNNLVIDCYHAEPINQYAPWVNISEVLENAD